MTTDQIKLRVGTWYCFNTSNLNLHSFVIQIKKACVSSSVTLFLYLTNVGLPLLFYLEVFPLSQYNSFIFKKIPHNPTPIPSSSHLSLYFHTQRRLFSYPNVYPSNPYFFILVQSINLNIDRF